MKDIVNRLEQLADDLETTIGLARTKMDSDAPTAEPTPTTPAPTTPTTEPTPTGERVLKSRDDVILPKGADGAKYMGALVGDTDPNHNHPLPSGTKWKDGTPYYPGIVEPQPTPPVVSQPVPTQDINDAAIELRAENDTDWLSAQWLSDVEGFVREDAQAENGTSVFIIYDAPDRDNGNFSAGGVATLEQYRKVSAAVARGIGDEPAMVIVEPDALGLISGLPADRQQLRYDCIQAGVDEYNKLPNTRVYVDASMWVPIDEMAGRLKRIRGIHGFSLNVSGYKDTPQCHAYGDALAVATGLTYVIDTSRNGNGNPHEPAWCNVTDTKVGVSPTIKTASRSCDAYVWAKIPGQSDGSKINGHDQDGQPWRGDVPRAGEEWPEFRKAIYSGDWTEFKKKYRV